MPHPPRSPSQSTERLEPHRSSTRNAEILDRMMRVQAPPPHGPIDPSSTPRKKTQNWTSNKNLRGGGDKQQEWTDNRGGASTYLRRAETGGNANGEEASVMEARWGRGVTSESRSGRRGSELVWERWESEQASRGTRSGEITDFKWTVAGYV
jgi:hypothetical protein